MPLHFTNRAQLEAFDEHCIQYGKLLSINTQDCPALRLLHDQFTASGIVGAELSRRIALALEIKLGFLHSYYDLHMLLSIENRYLVPDELRALYRPLDDVVSFSVALRRSRAAFGLITRIRSLWDKAFLYVALTYEDDATVRQLQTQRSKRKFFYRHFAAGFGTVTAETLTLASAALDSLERDFRTPELHGFGKIRKWVFDTPADWDTQHSSALTEHWSVLNTFLYEVFAASSTYRSSIE